MPEMLEEIEHVKGWEALERILYGGKHGGQPSSMTCSPGSN